MYQGKLKLIKANLLDPPISEQDLHDKCCMICLDVATHPVCCSICKSMYCLKCACIWKSENNECPKKCQKPWEFVPMHTLNLTLKCPYSDKCPKFIPENILEHLDKCEAIPPELKADLRRRKQYQCSNDHVLEFWLGEYREMTKNNCYECEEVACCRSLCRKCDQTYCVNCRPPPCTKTHCPLGHIYILTKASFSYICDICGLRPALFNQKSYDDIKCNFGMCESCHFKLPEVMPFPIPANDFQKCQNNHDLNYVQEITQGVCNSCGKESRIQRVCNTCNQRYCLWCKPIRLSKKETCLKKHQLKFVVEPSECRVCKSYEEVYEDESCGFSLCYGCVDQLVNHAGNHERITGEYCSNNQGHKLRERTVKRQCFQCKKQRVCFLGCGMCNISYCITCRPSKYGKEDYYGHPYAANITDQLECFGCGNVFHETLHCESCKIALCSECYGKL